MVKIDSGPVEASQRFVDVPKAKWRALMREKRDFLATSINYDCRCLVEFCDEAELVWQECGFSSASDMIRNGYELDPVEIDLAVAWLKHNNPQEEIGIADVSKRVAILEFRQEHPDWTQQQIADEVGVSQPYVNQVISKNFESKEIVIPDHLTGSEAKADYRKLPEELQQAVAAKKVSLNAAAIQAGIRKKPTPAEICVKAFKKADDRLAILKAIACELEPFEAAAMRDFAIERLT
jgi:predicted transcriptional regulator